MNSSGVAIGPVVGGFIAQHMDAKYVFIAMSMSCGAAAVIGIPFLRETYAPVIRSRVAKKTSNLEKAPQTLMTKDESIWKTLWLNLSRPAILLTHSFICFIFSLYLAM
jgi:MFS family permease